MPLFAKLSSAGIIVDLWINGDPTAPICQGYVDTTGWSGAVVQGATVVGTVCTAPAAPAVTTIALSALIARQTPAEQQAIVGLAQAQAAAGNPALLTALLEADANPIADVTAATTTTLYAALVAGGALTSARAAQILNLSEPSP